MKLGTRCTCLQCMPRAHFHGLWTNTCGLVLVQRMKWEKCEKAMCMHYIDKVRECECVFEPHRMRRYCRFIKMTMHFICFARRCCSLSYLTQTSRRWGCIYALSSPPFLPQALALSSLLPWQLLSFWRDDNETASAATALKMINLSKYTTFFVNRMF